MHFPSILIISVVASYCQINVVLRQELALWQFELLLLPSHEGKPVGLGNLRSIR